jgi:hypothetical protein
MEGINISMIGNNEQEDSVNIAKKYLSAGAHEKPARKAPLLKLSISMSVCPDLKSAEVEPVLQLFAAEAAACIAYRRC